MVFPQYNALIFANGCFWHGHDCHLFQWPKSREEFWRDKIGNNIRRDEKNLDLLFDAGWRICKVWECAIKGKRKLPVELIFDQCTEWLICDNPFLEITGT